MPGKGTGSAGWTVGLAACPSLGASPWTRVCFSVEEGTRRGDAADREGAICEVGRRKGDEDSASPGLVQLLWLPTAMFV